MNNIIETEEAISKYIYSRDITEFSFQILNLIKKHGYVHINQSAPTELFSFISDLLGKVIHKDQIKIRSEGLFAAYRPEEVFPHTDTSDAHVMGWWCLNQDLVDGSSVLIDSKNVLEKFSSDEIQVLKSLKPRYCSDIDKTKDNFTKFDEVSLVYERWGQLKINYAPWLEFELKIEEHKRIMTKFYNELELVTKKEKIEIRLNPGEMLFIDNGRLLHSRRALPQHSKRCLNRTWIMTRNTQ